MTAAPHPFIIRRDGRDLAGLEWGSGDDHVVLLHPNGFCAGLFDPLARRLATDHHVVAVDLAGHGCSSALPHDDLTFTRLASDVIAVLGRPGTDALHAYARWGLLDRADGLVQLACLPDTEATVFEVSGTADGVPAAWGHLSSLHASAVIIAGDRSFLPLAMNSKSPTAAAYRSTSCPAATSCCRRTPARRPTCFAPTWQADDLTVRPMGQLTAGAVVGAAGPRLARRRPAPAQPTCAT